VEALSEKLGAKFYPTKVEGHAFVDRILNLLESAELRET
jgi:hypothetical protein